MLNNIEGFQAERKMRSEDRIQDTQGIPKMTKALFLNVHNTWRFMNKVVFSLHLNWSMYCPMIKKMLTRGLESPPSPRSPVRCCGRKGYKVRWINQHWMWILHKHTFPKKRFKRYEGKLTKLLIYYLHMNIAIRQ